MRSTPQLDLALSSTPGVNHVRAGQGQPVIMVHGLAASLHDWDDLLPALAGAGFAGYALDLLGHGDSLKPSRLADYTTDHLYAHLRSWWDSLPLDQPAILIGHSLGGYLALRMAHEHPQRVRALVLVNPFYTLAQLPLVFRLIFKRPLLNTTFIERTPYWLFRALIDLSSLQLSRQNGEAHTLPARVRTQTARDYKRAAPGIYNLPRLMPVVQPDLSTIHHPVLVVWGQRDQTLSGASFPRLVASLPNASGYPLPECGHVPHQCHAARFNRLVLEYLTRLSKLS